MSGLKLRKGRGRGLMFAQALRWVEPRFLLGGRAELQVSMETASPSNQTGSLLLSLELASGSGQGLSPDRRASLLTSLLLVKRDYRYDRVLFWGRILGLVADYYIAQGLNALQVRRPSVRGRRRTPESGYLEKRGNGRVGQEMEGRALGRSRGGGGKGRGLGWGAATDGRDLFSA
ncbi:hypothetical protein P7K49_008031 [Saguinus oedipus]|uniref:Radial spoke head protein 9 homolog n=1 Tax=Saguinus oedipus TaxID=9490 RepID=A0ABQ9VWK6_SAGOE|nr:hypothetical protein P7K49_008031 [Saguinus oedipus]